MSEDSFIEVFFELFVSVIVLGPWEYISKQNRQNPCLCEAYILVHRRRNKLNIHRMLVSYGRTL